MQNAPFGKNEQSELDRLIARGSKVISLDGLTSVAAKSYVIANANVADGKTLVIITDSNSSLELWYEDLTFWARDKNLSIISLPSFEADVYSGSSPHAKTQENRALALWQLAHGSPDILLVSGRSLMMRTLTKVEILSLGSNLKINEDSGMDDLIDRLTSTGYVLEDPVGNEGQFSRRSGIVDVWAPNEERPVRIEFFGDTVDSIRSFDPETQQSIDRLSETSIAPMREFAASASDLKKWSVAAKERFAGDNYSRDLRDRTELASEGETFAGWEFLIPLVKDLKGNVIDLVAEPIIVVDEPSVIEQTLNGFLDQLESRHCRLEDAGQIGLAPDELFISPNDLRDRFEGIQRVELRALGRTQGSIDDELKVEAALIEPISGSGSFDISHSAPAFLFPSVEVTDELSLPSRSVRNFHGNFKALSEELKQSDRVAIVARSSGIAERLAEIVKEYDIKVPLSRILIGNLSGGFEFLPDRSKIFTETEIFGEAVSPDRGIAPVGRSSSTGKRPKLGAFVSDFRDLKPGDYVVHVDHGLGKFEGLQTISAQGSEREFMLLVYADGAKLFVPVERLDLVSRYSSGEATAPTLDRLGGLGWQKTKAKAKRAMRDMADELLKLYAERKLVSGYAFSPDAPWQHEFEDAFPYELTVDQGKAIDDVKEDMETPRPMDRLIIGDVGYGKTEVAMRAAFKAVMDGKQVAVLTPTTILAYQHFESFKRRFAAFPASIDLLSRFRSTKEQKEVVAAAEKGDVDVLIGTHRVLSNDVKLPKLGLVVVDEEQRFGVAHKEKLKQLKKKVDVLTLSATPIPRTLNMSLLGMRDLSVIETPPRDRLAINTQVVQFSENVIRAAIDLELSRNGQVFFIHNRVETIEAIAALVQNIVPNARIAVGHGKMNEKEMEQVMLDFIDFKYDVLVATTIIENGIDIPRANTIIINRADNYGLSQLYQLRGRVGRSNRRAYAYLLIPSEIELTPIARRRLSAIREFSDLGAGFRIAALDLELRGAGNILGGQQSGHLDALGFDLYTKMLERTIAELRGEEVSDEVSVAINLGIDLAIPKDYITETGQRLRTYKRIASASTRTELNSIRDEVQDRYGQIPASVENLLSFAGLRQLAEKMNIVSIDASGEGYAVKLGEGSKVMPERLLDLVEGDPNFSFSPNGILRSKKISGTLIRSIQETLESIRLK